MPEILSWRTGPSAWTPISSPTLNPFLSAVAASITTSPSPGQAPATSVSGLNGESPFAIEKPRLGAPPNTIAFPFRSINCVESLSTLPSAAATPSTPRTFSSSDWSNGGAVAPEPPERSNAALPVTTAVEPWRLSVKIELKAWSIESVST